MKLVIEDDQGSRREVALDRDEITIGRREDNVVHLPDRNVSRRHARLLRKEGSVLLEDLRSANGTLVNGVRITEPVSLGNGDLVRIGDYGVAVRPDEVPLEIPLPRTTPPEPPAALRGDVLADTAPHPLVAAPVEIVEEPAPAPTPAAVAELEPPVRRSRRALGVVILGLVLGLGGALVLRAQIRENEASRLRSAVPPPPTPEVVAEPPPPTPAEPPPLELTPLTVPASRPSTATEWMAAARSAAEARDFDRALRLLSSVRDRSFQAEAQTLRRTWRAEAVAGRAVRSARKELDSGRPSGALRRLEPAKNSRAWAPEVAELRAEITAALKSPRKPQARTATAADVERLYREGKTLYDNGNVGEAAGRFERCLSLDRNQPRCHLMLASSYARGGDTGRAEAHYRRFLALASADDPAVPRVKKFLEDSDAEKKARASSATPQR
ncbi:MAG TPA: FHA domain-containing protein [Myxococcaceae bacterium]|nr:FHA domain-containing protein [Myxococcaceae bacterium]